MRVRLVATLLGVLCGACDADLSVPPDIRVQCTSDAECPASYLCSKELERCVKPGEDVVAPGLVDGINIDTPLANENAPVRIVFTPDEPLGEDPTVQLLCGEQAIDVDQVMSSDGNTYTFTYTPDDQTPEGGCDVTVSLVDEAGNAASPKLPNAVTFDFTSPAVLESSIALVPGSQNPLPVVTAAAEGTTIEVEVLADDEVTSAAQVTTVQTTNLVFSLTRTVGTLYTYEAVVEVDASEGTFDLRFDGADAAGNPITVGNDLGTVVVDRTAPLPPGVDVLDAVLLRRAPWDTLGVPAHAEIQGAAGAVEANALVQIRTSAASGSMQVAEVFADGLGAFGPTGLPTYIGPQVFVRAIDAAGNTSDERGTRDGEWVASAQPASLYPAIEVALAAASTVELGPASLGSPVSNTSLATAEGDGTGAVSATGRRTWRQRSHGEVDLLRSAAAVAYDSRRSRTWVFGGLSSVLGSALQDMWAWNGHDWSQVVQQGESPPARFGAKMAYDLNRDRLILFGGAMGAESVNNGQTLDDLWEFDGSTWTQIPPSGDWPSARTRHAMAYDYDRGTTVLFGGCSDGYYTNCTTTQLADTWEWDGSGWQQVHDGVTGDFPPARSAAAMVYAPAVGGCVMTGGCSSGATQHFGICQAQLGDTWIWDGTTWQSSVASGWRAYHNLVFNSADQTVMAVGGCRSQPAGDDCDDQLSLYPRTWDGGASWNIYNSNGNAPLRNFDGIVAYDAARAELVIALGHYSAGLQLWRYTAVSRSSTDTRVVHDATRLGPTARQGMRAAYDSAALDSGTPQIVFYGGQLTGGDAEQPTDLSEFSNELWRLAEGQWLGPTTAGTPRARVGMAVDESRRHLVIVGGHDHGSPLGDTLEADLASSNPGGWEVCDETGLDPMAGACWPGGWVSHVLWSAPAIYDPLATPNPVVRVFGGFNYIPSPAAAAVTARDDADDWDGTAGLWADGHALPLVSASPLIDKRAAFGVAYDSLREVVVLYGGMLDDGRGGTDPYDPAQDTWEWSRDSGDWSLVCDGDTGCPCPGKRSYFGLVYDSVRARVVLFGGAYGVGRANDVWEWDGTAWARMGVIGAGPESREDAAVAYDPDNRRLVVFGGRTAAGVQDDLWQLDLGESTSPMAAIDVDWGRSGVSLAHATSVELEVGAGARGYTTDAELVVDTDTEGGAVDGARVSGWNWRAGRWEALQQNTASPSSPATTLVPSDSLDWANTYRDPSSGMFQFAIRPVAGHGNGPAPPEVLVDYAVFRARYRLPGS